MEESDYYFRELSHGRFERSFVLPEGVKTDDVKATFRNGVLEVAMPAGEIETARKVPIEIADADRKPVKAA